MARQAIKITGDPDLLKKTVTALNNLMVGLMDKNFEEQQPEAHLNLPDNIIILVHGKNDMKAVLSRVANTFKDLNATASKTKFGSRYSYKKDDSEVLAIVAMSEVDAYERNWNI